MRITNSTLLRNYDRNLKRLSTQKFASENKIYTGRQYTRASQSPLKAAKALTIRKQLWHTEQYQENLEVADKFYTEAETSLLQVSGQLASIRETMIYACNSTKDKATDLNILAEQLETKAKELCSIFNTNSAERAIFGGESNSNEPFTLEYDENGTATTVLYHGVPVNAYDSDSDFPYSNGVYIDIGIGMVINDNQEVDPQSVLKVSFNGADVTGCGFEDSGKTLTTIRPESLKSGETDSNTVRITASGKTVTVTFNGNKTEDIQTAITNAFNNAGVTDPNKIPTINSKGELTMGDGSSVYVSETPSINIDKLNNGQNYTVDIYASGTKKTITFTAGADTATTAANIQAKLNEAFKYEKHTPTIDESGNLKVEYLNSRGETVSGQVYIAKSDIGTQPDFKNGDTYSKNYIQVTLDAAAALRRGDISYANACIDRIVTSSENLLVEIADLGNAEEYIEFNQNRFDTRTLNLQERQKSLEATDLESEITLMKTYEALYNACLQMSSSIVPNSIFNYIK
ncbi:MAG: hypothetical protein SPD47_10615 [Oscillospiraceae bacterium]|nr:hypothetical protein [Oscillospiraceae bacterium]